MDSPNETSYAELSKDRVCSGCVFCMCLCRAGEGGPWLQLRAGREGAVCDGCGLCHGIRASPHAQGLLLWIPRPLPRMSNINGKELLGYIRNVNFNGECLDLQLNNNQTCSQVPGLSGPSLNQVSRVLFTDLSWSSASQALVSVYNA